MVAEVPEIETLVEAAREGGAEAKRRAVRAMVEVYGGEVLGYLVKRVPNHERATAEDLLQKTFLRVLQSLGSLKHTASLRYWLLTIARHQLLDHMRRRARRGPQEMLHDAHPDPHNPDPERSLLERERLTLANAAAEDLTPRQREVLELAAAGHNNQDIARLLGVRPGTVGALKFKAIERVRANLEELEQHRQGGGLRP